VVLAAGRADAVRQCPEPGLMLMQQQDSEVLLLQVAAVVYRA
jgi:hypothetical protein